MSNGDAHDVHRPVLLKESVDALNLQEDSVVVDATLGNGGHAREILTHLGPKGVFVGIDQDPVAVSGFVWPEDTSATVHLANGNFRKLGIVLSEKGVTEADAIIADLGWRIEQMRGNGKGFSFMYDEPLQMTLGKPEEYAFTARDIVNDWAEEDIANVLKGYGEEQYAKRIARRIVSVRAEAPIETSGQLREVVFEAVPGWYRKKRIHPATKTFQALRIAVNDELEALTAFIEEALHALDSGGRLAIITFHSVEDRIVKQQFRRHAHDGTGTIVTKKPIAPTREETAENPRARSAKLRIFEKGDQ